MTNGNDTAYPEIFAECDGSTNTTGGLTKRELFAAMAMQGLLNNRDICQAMTDVKPEYREWAPEKLVSSFAIEYADALIEALNKEQP